MATIEDDDALAAALRALAARDETAARMAAVAEAPPLRRRAGGFEGLAAIVTSQQLSTRSADAIFGRLKAAVDPLTAQGYLAADDAALAALGLSGPKRRTLRAAAEAVASGALDLPALAHMSPDEARAALTKLPGIGPWSADIYLLFCLSHADAFPAGDLALQVAAGHAFGLAERPSAKALEQLAERWRPHRGVAARLLWSYYRVVRPGHDGQPAGTEAAT